LDRQAAELDKALAEAGAEREVMIVAPEAGTLTAMRAVAGGGVTAADTLMTLVPAGARLEARLYGPSRAISFVRPGQRVLLRYDAYPHQKFGHYAGTVTSVSRATVGASELAGVPASSDTRALVAERDEPLYRVTVALDAQTATAYGAAPASAARHDAQADVLIETRRVWQWVLDPLYALRGGQPHEPLEPPVRLVAPPAGEAAECSLVSLAMVATFHGRHTDPAALRPPTASRSRARPSATLSPSPTASASPPARSGSTSPRSRCSGRRASSTGT
jgi:hypothetical protein